MDSQLIKPCVTSICAGLVFLCAGDQMRIVSGGLDAEASP